MIRTDEYINLIRTLSSSKTKPGTSVTYWINCLKKYPFRAVFLKALAETHDIQITTIAEIGVYQGFSSEMFRKLFPDATLYLIDPWEMYPEYLEQSAGPATKEGEMLEQAYQHVRGIFENDPLCHIIRKTSLDAVKEVPDNLDLVFIDGNHSYKYVKEDVQCWLPKVRKGGILSGHDYNEKLFPEVVSAVHDVLRSDVDVGSDDTWFHFKP